MNATRPVLQDVLDAWPNLNRRGREWVGPCPSCGGTDRFWVKQDGRIGCRGCNPGKDNPDAYRAIMEALGFVGEPGAADDWFTDEVRNAGREPPRPDRIMADIVESREFGPNSFEEEYFIPFFDNLQNVEFDTNRNGALDKLRELLPDVLSFIEMGEQYRRRAHPRASFILALRQDNLAAIKLVAKRAEKLLAVIDSPLTMQEFMEAKLIAPANVLSGAGEDGAVLTEGEVALLSGEGGLGKTTAALQIGLVAAAGGGLTMGLRVANAPCLIASVEDRAFRMVQRLRRIQAEATGSTGRFVMRSPSGEFGGEELFAALADFGFVDLGDEPLFAAENRWEQATPTGAWERLWCDVDRIAPGGGCLVVIDPVSAAFDVEHNSMGSVRRVVRALRREATNRRASILCVSHSNKRGRGKDADDSDMVAGSAGWVDAVRGVLTLTRYPTGGKRDSVLRCLKANYGPRGWGQRLMTLKGSYVWREAAGGLKE